MHAVNFDTQVYYSPSLFAAQKDSSLELDTRDQEEESYHKDQKEQEGDLPTGPRGLLVGGRKGGDKLPFYDMHGLRHTHKKMERAHKQKSFVN